MYPSNEILVKLKKFRLWRQICPNMSDKNFGKINIKIVISI